MNPPQHRAGAKHIYVWDADPAWDLDKIESDRKAIDDAEQGGLEHPVEKYYTGESRYDIDAEYQAPDGPKTARSYLKGTPTEFELRPLEMREFYEVRGLLALGPSNAWKAGLRALEHGLVGGEGPLAPKMDANGTIKEESLERLFKRDHNLPIAIGNAVWLLSQPPNDAEKKPSG